MLQSIREKASGPLAWAIVGIISVPFAFFGIEAFRSGGGTNYAAKVNGEEITRFELDNRVDARYTQFQQMLGDNFSPEMFNRAQLRSGVLEDLIQETVVRQFLEESGHRVSDARVVDFIASQDAFKDADGRFSPELYREAMSRQGSSTSAYEARVRAYLNSSQFESAIRDSSLVTPAEMQSEWAWQEQQRTIQWRRYKQSFFADGVEVGDDEVTSLYSERQSTLMTPERIQVSYLELDPNAMAAEIDVAEADIEAVYAGDQERYKVPETRTVRHILIKDEDKVETVREKLLAGADFAEMAKEYSEDPGSKNNGGDLGPVARGVMVAPFEEAVFSLDVNKLSEPVETQFGWHLIEVTAIAGGTVKPLEEVRDQIADSIRQKEARAKLSDLQEQLEQLTFENPGSLEPASSALGVELQTSAWFTREGGAGLTADQRFIDVAFSDAVLNSGENSPLINVNGSVVALRLSSREEPRVKTLEEVRDQLVAELRRKKAREALAAAVDKDLGVLANGGEWASLEATDAVQTYESATYKRNAGEVDRALLQAAFGVSEVGSPAKTELTNGDMAIVEVTAITDGDWKNADENARTALRQKLASRIAGSDMMALVSALRAQAKVVYARANSDTEN